MLFATELASCYRKANINVQLCSADDHLDLFVVLSPPSPPAVPAPPAPPPSPPLHRVAAINARFRRSPYIPWPDSGAPADAALLIHVFDDWEEHDSGVYHNWRADLRQRPQLSASIIWADQRALTYPQIGIPIFNNYAADGVILRWRGSADS